MDSTAIEVSVICNTYNQKQYISEAIDSMLAQRTTFNYEIIVHDDASNDGTSEIVEQYASIHPEIVPIIEKENQYSKGKGVTLNLVSNYAKGKYIAFCEGDDFWIDADKLQLQYDWMENHKDCSLVACEGIKVRPDGQIIGPNSDYFFSHSHEMSFLDVMSNQLAFTTNSMFFRKSFFDDNYAFLSSVPLYDYVYKCLLAANGNVYCIPKCMVAYRRHAEGSWTQSVLSNPAKHIEHFQKSIVTMQKMKVYLGKEYESYFDEEIRKREFSMLRIKNDDDVYKNPRYRDLFNSLTMNKKIKTYVLCMLQRFRK